MQMLPIRDHQLFRGSFNILVSKLIFQVPHRTTMTALPIVDLKNFFTADLLAARLMEVGKEPGFFYLIGHEVSETLIERMFRASKEFFENVSDYQRQRYSAKSGEPGFSGFRKEKLSGLGRGDLKESFHFNSFSASHAPDLPPVLEEHRRMIRQFSDDCERVGKALLEGFAAGLDLPGDFLARHHTGVQNRFRMLHYPKVALDPTTGLNVYEHIRCGTHSDYGTLTLLFQEPMDKGGLQVFTDGIWKSVPAIPSAIVVNIGDALEFWTAGRLRSTVHRVKFPRPEGENESRYSIPFFITADDETVLAPLSSAAVEVDEMRILFERVAKEKGYTSLEPVTAREHRMMREEVFGGSAGKAVVLT